MKKMVLENWRKEKYQRDTVLLDYTKCPQGTEVINEGKLLLSTMFQELFQNPHLTRETNTMAALLTTRWRWWHKGNKVSEITLAVQRVYPIMHNFTCSNTCSCKSGSDKRKEALTHQKWLLLVARSQTTHKKRSWFSSEAVHRTQLKK